MSPYDENHGLASAAAALAVSDAASARSAALPVGQRIRVTASSSCHVVLTTSTGDATVNDPLLAAGESIEVEPTQTLRYLAGICPSGGSAGVLTFGNRRLA